MQIELKKLVHVPSRTGRELQRFDHLGRRQVVGCIPYRYVTSELSSSVHRVLEVLMVSSQKGETMMFPKGGWEKDETKQAAALRECLEEAGVIGTIQSELGQWIYKSKNQDTLHDGYMFPLLVEEQLDYWPEKDLRQRKWVTVIEAKKLCPHIWMSEALDKLVQRLAEGKANKIEASLHCFPNDVLSLHCIKTSLNSDERFPITKSIVTQLSLVQREIYPVKRFKAQRNESTMIRSLSMQFSMVEQEAITSRPSNVDEYKRPMWSNLSNKGAYACSDPDSCFHVKGMSYIGAVV